MNGIDWTASAMKAAQARLDVAAANLANVSSDGYRKHRARQWLSARGIATAVREDGAQGALRHTGRPFDLALIGAGTFHVAPRGDLARSEATRAGSFTRTRDGFLEDDRGRRLLGAAGPLVVSENARVGADGTVRDGAKSIGRLALPPGSSIRTGFVESTNVNAIREMVDVIVAQRAFETAQKTLAALDEARDKAVNDVARVK